MQENMKIKKNVLLLITLAGIAAVFLVGRIPQDPGYHLFADSRCLHAIPNFWNVISNLPFLIIGFLGMFFILQNREKGKESTLWVNGFIFFLGIFFTGIGSGYYHFHPANETLLWDRLPMTISFMAFFSIVIGNFICESSGRQMLFPLVFIGLMSIIYWQMTESKGTGDLRFYVLVQFLPIVLIPIILLIFSTNKNLKIYYWMILLVYIIAKSFEASDHFVFNSFHVVSGHTIKHIIAAVAPFIFLGMNIKSHREK